MVHCHIVRYICPLLEGKFLVNIGLKRFLDLYGAVSELSSAAKEQGKALRTIPIDLPCSEYNSSDC